MMAVPGGIERTEDQFARLFGRAGLRLASILPLTPELAVISAHA